ncbi:hypothetical protein [Azospirillum endophyticum]
MQADFHGKSPIADRPMPNGRTLSADQGRLAKLLLEIRQPIVI